MQKRKDLLKAILAHQDKIRFILAVDSGNTHDRYSLFDRKENKYIIEFEKDFSKLASFFLTNDNTLLVQSKVSSSNNLPIFSFHLSPNDLRENDFLIDMPINYSESLGEDRLIAAFNTFKNHTQEKILVIDSGSFTTVDLVTKNGFMGGYILPGKKLLEESYFKGAKLTGAQIHEYPFELPQNTDNAINHGAFLSFFTPITYLIEKLNPDLIILTGFNGELIAKSLESNQNFSSKGLLLSPNLILNALTTFAMGVIDNAHSFSR